MNPRLTFFFEGDDFFAALQDSIRKAHVSIDIEFYYFASDEIGASFAKLLTQKVAEGVEVRLIYDALGCLRTDASFFAELEQQGIAVKPFHPLFPISEHLGRRDHRKLMVVDGEVGFVGGFNLSSEYSARFRGPEAWRDTGLGIWEDVSVQRLKRLFQENWEGLWYLAKMDVVELWRGELRPDWQQSKFHMIPNHGWRRKSLIRQEYLAAIIHAKRCIHLTNPYFIPDRGIRRALRRAAQRGVEVALLTAGVTDVRIARWAGQATYARLLGAGVRLFEYQGRFLHAKSATVDGEWFTVGTSNIDHISFFRNLEVNLFGRDGEAVGVLDGQFVKDLTSSREITLQDWRQRPWWVRVRSKFFFYFRVWL